MAEKKQKPIYRALVGMNVPGKRIEAGEVTDAIPAESLWWLIEQGYVEPVEKEA